jgi:hypothetical protein
MSRSKFVGIAMAALAAVSCGSDGSDGEDSGLDHPTVDVEKLLSRAGHSSNDNGLAYAFFQIALSCMGDNWSSEVYWAPTSPPPLDRVVLVAWDMSTGTLKGWDLARDDVNRSHWWVRLSAEEVGFGCGEHYATSFFLLATWPDQKISRAIGFERANRFAFNEYIGHDGPVMASYYTLLNFVRANLPAPDTATYYVKNLFTGATFSTDVPAEDSTDIPPQGPPAKFTELEVDYGKLGLGGLADVVTGVMYKREGVELTNHCLTLTDDTLP